MNRLNQLFQNKKESLLSIYFTAGYPNLTSTLDIAEAVEKAGADFIEIGFPYSDPLADGPVIQNSSLKIFIRLLRRSLDFQKKCGIYVGGAQ